MRCDRDVLWSRYAPGAHVVETERWELARLVALSIRDNRAALFDRTGGSRRVNRSSDTEERENLHLRRVEKQAGGNARRERGNAPFMMQPTLVSGSCDRWCFTSSENVSDHGLDAAQKAT